MCTKQSERERESGSRDWEWFTVRKGEGHRAGGELTCAGLLLLFFFWCVQDCHHHNHWQMAMSSSEPTLQGHPLHPIGSQRQSGRHFLSQPPTNSLETFVINTVSTFWMLFRRVFGLLNKVCWLEKAYKEDICFEIIKKCASKHALKYVSSGWSFCKQILLVLGHER